METVTVNSILHHENVISDSSESKSRQSGALHLWRTEKIIRHRSLATDNTP
jgi:hypothetical protein